MIALWKIIFSLLCVIFLLKFSVEESCLSNESTCFNGTESYRDYGEQLTAAALVGDTGTIRDIIRQRGIEKYICMYEAKEKKRVKDGISTKLMIMEKLISTELVAVASQEYVQRNQGDKSLFKVTIVPGTDIVTYFLVNMVVANSWDSTFEADERKPLHIMCELPDIHPDTIQYLLENGKDDINVKTIYNYTPLIIAAGRGNFGLVKFLVENGAGINDMATIPVETHDQVSHYSYMKLFASKEVIFRSVSYPYSPLVAAVYAENKDVLIYLLQHGADISVNNHTWTLLFHPVMLGRIRIVEILLEYGIDVKVKDTMGSTALHKAAEEGLVDVAILLLNNGADINATDCYGWTPLHVACLFSSNATIAMIKFLLDSGSDVNAKTTDSFTPLILTLAGYNYVFLDYLIRKLEVMNDTTIHRGLAQQGRTEEHDSIIIMLIESGANYNHQDGILGWSPLHWAAASDDIGAAEILGSYGVVVSSRSKMGLTPYETAEYFARRKMSEFLSTLRDLV